MLCQEILENMMNKEKTGDLVYIIDKNNKEPYKVGIGLVIGEARSYGGDSRFKLTPVLWGGKVVHLDARHWILESIKKT